MVNVILQQIILQDPHRENTKYFVVIRLNIKFEMDYPPINDMDIQISDKHSISIDSITYDIRSKIYTCYPEFFEMSHVFNKDKSVEEVIEKFEAMGYELEENSKIKVNP